MDIESDLRKIERELDTASKDNYDHYLFQEGDKKTEEELKERHDLETQLLTALEEKKTEEFNKIKAKDDKLEKDFENWKELQDNYKEQRDLKEGTQKAKIKIQFLNIQVKLLEDSVQFLNEKRDELTNETVDAQTKNEELKN